MAKQATTVLEFIVSGRTGNNATSVEFEGFAARGDEGNGIRFFKTGSQSTASQTPIQRGDNSFTDANGWIYALNNGSVIYYNGSNNWFPNLGSSGVGTYTSTPTSWNIASVSQSNTNVEWDFEVVFNDGVELRSGYGTRNIHGNKAVDISRASSSGNINKSGVVETLAVDEAAITSHGLSVYESYINYFVNPDSPVTQVCTIPAGDYTLWVLGSGSATTSYGAATDDNPVSFVSAGESLTVTITGVVTLCNLINLNKIAPPILTTSVPASRDPEVASIPMMNNMPAPGKPFTIEIDLTLIGSDSGIFAQSISGALFNARQLSDGSITFQCHGRGPVTAPVERGNVRLTFVFDESVKIYVSSIKSAESSTVTSPDYNVVSEIEIGVDSSDTYLNSSMKAFRIKHTPLSDEVIAARGGYNS